MRTSGRRLKSGERSRGQCDRCGALWDRDKLWRDREGLLNCPQEGTGRDAVELTEANIASAKAWSDAKRPQSHDPGRYDKTPATPIGQRTGNILTESGFALLTQLEDFLSVESGPSGFETESSLPIFTEGGQVLLS